MMTPTDPRDHVLNILAANTAIQDGLPAVRARYHVARDNGHKPNAEVRAARDVAEREGMIRQGNKLAEIYALLYVGDRIDALTQTIAAQRLTAAELDYLISHPETGV